LRQVGGEGSWHGVDIAQGRLHLEGCDITSQSSARVSVHYGADPRLLRNRIHDGKNTSVLVFYNGQVILEDNDIFANFGVGVAIKTGVNSAIRENRISKNERNAMTIVSGGGGVFEGSDLPGNKQADCMRKNRSFSVFHSDLHSLPSFFWGKVKSERNLE
jgi:hypothetical protein